MVDEDRELIRQRKKKYQADYRAEHKQQISEYNRNYRAAHPRYIFISPEQRDLMAQKQGFKDRFEYNDKLESLVACCNTMRG